VTQAVDWSKIGVRIVQGLNTTIDAVRQLDTQEAPCYEIVGENMH